MLSRVSMQTLELVFNGLYMPSKGTRFKGYVFNFFEFFYHFILISAKQKRRSTRGRGGAGNFLAYPRRIINLRRW
jgi:hypothetical protein